MGNGKSIVRSVRLTQIQHLLHSNSRGFTSQELARLCGVCVRTIQRDLRALEAELGVPLTQEGDRYGILEGYVLPPVSFSLFEAMAVFLASRLSLRQTDENNPHVQLALTKIAAALPLPLAQQTRRGIDSISSKAPNPNFVQVFERVAIAWTARRQMRIQYRSLHSQETREWLLEPYFVEMTGVGYSTYVIGYATREGKEGLITFKLDRIESAEVLDKNFEIPPELDVMKLLANSWGIFWGEETSVKLRFSPNVARRVKEAVWHPSQVIEDLPDGGCLFKVRVGSTLEMTPWIRSWGPDAEVLEPESLRKDFRIWAEKLCEIYQSNHRRGHTK